MGGGSDSESDLESEDVHKLLEGFTSVSAHVEGPYHYAEIPTGQNLLLEEDNLISMFAPLCSEEESRSLRDVSDVGLMTEVAVMGFRVVWCFPFVSFHSLVCFLS